MVISSKSVIFALRIKNTLSMKYIRRYDEILAEYIIDEVNDCPGDGVAFFDIIMSIFYILSILFLLALMFAFIFM